LEAAALAFGASRKWGRKRRIKMSYLNSVTLVGFVGADPEQRQVRSNGSKFTVLSLATQRSWKNAQDEWTSKTEWHRVSIFRPRLAEYVAENVKKGAHILVEGSLVSSTYEPPNGKGKKTSQTKVTSWSIRADVVRRLDRGEPEPASPEPTPADVPAEGATL
jgi:single stranded DNA-binding protein